MRKDSEMVSLRSVIETLFYMVDDDSDGVEEVMQLPTIDLVRCKECKNAFNVEGEWICNHLSGMVGLNVVVNADGFCSYGERKEKCNE